MPTEAQKAGAIKAMTVAAEEMHGNRLAKCLDDLARVASPQEIAAAQSTAALKRAAVFVSALGLEIEAELRRRRR
jgi:hypothetical protein